MDKDYVFPHPAWSSSSQPKPALPKLHPLSVWDVDLTFAESSGAPAGKAAGRNGVESTPTQQRLGTPCASRSDNRRCCLPSWVCHEVLCVGPHKPKHRKSNGRPLPQTAPPFDASTVREMLAPGSSWLPIDPPLAPCRKSRVEYFLRRSPSHSSDP